MAVGRALTSVFWLASQTIARQVISFFLFVCLGRLIGPRDFGIVSVSASIVAILQIFSSQGIAQAVIQHTDLTDDEASVAYTFNLLISTTMAVLVCLGAFTHAAMGPGRSDTFSLVLTAIALLLPVTALYEVQQARLVRDFAFHIIARKAIAAQTIGGIAAVAAAFKGLGAWSLVVQQYTVTLIELCIVLSVSTWRPTLLLRRESAKHLLHFGGYLFGARFLNTVEGRGPDLIVGAATGQVNVGFFKIARSIVEVAVSLLIHPIHGVSLPLFSSKQADMAGVRRSFMQMCEATSWVVLPPFIVLMIWAPQVIAFLFGDKWHGSGWILQILSLQAFLFAIFYLYDPLLVGIGRPRDVLMIRCWQTGTSIVLAIAAAPFGFVAIVISQAASGFISAPMTYRYISRALDVDVAMFASRLWKPFLSAGIFAAIASTLYFGSLGRYGIPGLCGAVGLAYAAFCMCFLFGAGEELRERLFTVVRHFRTRRA